MDEIAAATARALDRLRARHPDEFAVLLADELAPSTALPASAPRATRLGFSRPVLPKDTGMDLIRVTMHGDGTITAPRPFPRPPFTPDDWRHRSEASRALIAVALDRSRRPRVTLDDPDPYPRFVLTGFNPGEALIGDGQQPPEPLPPPERPQLHTGLDSNGKRHAARHPNGTAYALCRQIVTTGPYGPAARIDCHKCRTGMQ